MADKYYKLLWQIKPAMPKPNLLKLSPEVLDDLKSKLSGQEFAFDFEASGLDIWGEVFWIRSVSFHNDEVSCSVEIRGPEGELINHEVEKELYEWFTEQTGLVAHNYYYEGSVLYRATGQIIPAKCCTRKTFMDLANEGYEGQSWALDEGIRRLLQWPPNNTELNAWLKERKLTKAKMHLAPFDILGYYNQLDSAATWELYKLFCQCIEDYHDTWGQYYWEHIEHDYMALLMLQIESYKEGLTIDLDALKSYQKKVTKERDEFFKAFVKHPKVAKYIRGYEKAQRNQIVNKNKQYTKDGRINKNWQKFEDKKEELMESIKFNVDSADQIRWLISKVFDVRQQGKIYKIYEKEGS